ncbi:MAG: ribonuclease HI family protein [Acidobacteria bacterium]|nr:ribonuclease HI family protein [Acidobacteriota bacterium]
MTDRQSLIKQDHSGVSAVGELPEIAQAGPLEIYCDGAVLVNPGGPGGWGIVVESRGRVVHREHGALRNRTNNEAEYRAIIHALDWLCARGVGYASATIYSDSMLAVNQINGEWECRKEYLAWMCGECRRLIAQSKIPVSVEWTPREANIEADTEAARGVAEALGVEEEEALFVLEAARRKYKYLKMADKAKKLLLREGLVSEVVTIKRRRVRRGKPRRVDAGRRTN